MLQRGFGLGELRLGVDAAHVVLLGLDHDRLQPHGPGDRDGIGEIIFAFAIVVADPLEDGERGRAGKRHQAAVAESDRPFGRTGIELLADGDELAAFQHEAAIAGRIPRPKAEHDDRGTLGECVAHPDQRLRPNQRRVAEDDENVVGARAIATFAASTACAVPRRSRLHEDVGGRQDAPGFGGNGIGAGSDHDRGHRAAGLAHGIEHMGEQRPAGDRVQHLGSSRAHAGALAGREHDGEAAAFTQWASSEAHDRWRRHIRVAGSGKGRNVRTSPCLQSDPIRPLVRSFVR